MNTSTRDFQTVGQTGAQTAAGNLVQTAGFLHDAADTAILRFRSSGDTPRMFMAFIAQGRYKDGVLDPSLNGITIVDIDNARLIAMKIKPRKADSGGVTAEQRFGLAILETLVWENFASYCRNAAGYHRNVAEIEEGRALPYSGNPENQKKVGPAFMPQIDIRSEFLSFLDQDPEVPYSVPQTTRQNAITEIIKHGRFTRDDDRFYLACDIRMNFKWNSTGVVEDGNEVSSQYDECWSKHYQTHPEVFEKACESVLAPFLSLDFAVLDLGEEAVCHLDVMGPNCGHLVVKEFAGQPMIFDCDDSLRRSLEAMPVEDLANLWATLRVIDVDLGRQERARLMENENNVIRAEIEEEWSQVHDQEALYA